MATGSTPPQRTSSVAPVLSLRHALFRGAYGGVSALYKVLAVEHAVQVRLRRRTSRMCMGHPSCGTNTVSSRASPFQWRSHCFCAGI